jgi:AAA ATPase domain
MLTHLALRNFKSFQDLDLHLGAFNVFVGANAAGKSNILQAFKFIHDISIHGLENAVAIQGGFKFLRNVHCNRSDEVVIEALVTSKQQFFLPVVTAKKQDLQSFSHCQASEIRHHLVLAADGTSFSIKEDSIFCKFNVLEDRFKGGISGTISASHKADKVTTDIQLDKGSAKLEPGMAKIWRSIDLSRRSALAFSSEPISLLSIPNPNRAAGDLNISYYDFDPRLSKQAVRISGSSDLDESADNLAVVIQKIVSNPKQKERLLKRVEDLLPYVKGLDLEHFSDSSLLMNLREQYVSDFAFPASLISNGTVRFFFKILISSLWKSPNAISIRTLSSAYSTRSRKHLNRNRFLSARTVRSFLITLASIICF